MSSVSNLTYQFPIEKILPEKEYRSRFKGEKKIAPIFLIALGKPEKTIFEYLDNPNYHESKYGLTPLAVATMVGNHQVMEHLLNLENIDPLPRDFGDLTPIHYASIRNDRKALELLQKKVKNVSLTIFENFPGWRMYLESRFPGRDKIVIDYLEEGKMRHLTETDFHQKTGAHFYEGVLGSRSSFMDLFVHRLNKHPFKYVKFKEFNTFLIGSYKKFQINPPQFYMEYQKTVGLGIFAKEKLKAGEICAEYNGKLYFSDGDLSPEKEDYYLPGRDASQLRGVGSMINDSFPNAAYYPLYFQDGRLAMVLIPFRDIQEGEAVFIDYLAGHRIKHNRHVELNLDEMERFFKDHTVDQLLSIINSNINLGTDNPEIYCPKTLEANGIGSCLVYPFNTPSSLIYLYLKQTLTWTDINKLYSSLYIQATFDGKSVKDSLLIPTVKLIEKLDEYFSRYQRKTVEQYIPWLLELSQKYSFKGTLEAFSNHFSFDIMEWKKNLEVVAQATEKYEFILSKSSTEEQKITAFEEYTAIIQHLPLEIKVSMSTTLFVLFQKYPELGPIMAKVIERHKSKYTD